MAEVLFYHLTTTPVEATLPGLLEKVLARSMRAVVRCGSREALDHLDTRLWTWEEASFLPHGTAEMGHAARQPVYLTCGTEAPNGAEVLMLVMGARAHVDEMTSVIRTCILFDGADPAAVAMARDDWKAVVAAGLSARYWAQIDGRWTEKARHDG